jgi:hypothetical protein
MKNIAIAFIKAKKEFSPALKNKVNGGFKSKYADLGACLDAVDDAFLNNGIAMYQETCADDTGITIETVLLHESGEFLKCGRLHLPAAKQDPQGYGSALSYARRYSLMTACGIAQEDDDGQVATKAVYEAPKSPAPALKPPALSDAEGNECKKAMAGCTDMETLKGIFGGAYKRANDVQKEELNDFYKVAKLALEGIK